MDLDPVYRRHEFVVIPFELGSIRSYTPKRFLFRK